MARFELLIFDLDGTLADTAADIAAGVNHALAEFGLGTVPTECVRAFVGDGAHMLLKRALGLFKQDVPDAQIEQAVRLHLEYYRAHACDRTRLYPGVRETLPLLGGVKTIVTNKPTAPSRMIVETLGVAEHFGAVCGADAFPKTKPDPMPILAMVERFGVEPGQTLMVGDGAQDIQAGKAAGVRTCGAAYGFRGAAALELLRPDYIIGAFCELAAL